MAVCLLSHSLLRLVMMMIIIPNYVVRQKEGAQGDEAVGRIKVGPTGTPIPGTEAPTGPTQSGVLDVRNKRKHGRWYEVPLHRKGRGG